MTETKRAIKWWWSWEPEILEDWLEKKEAEGWHLFNINAQIIFNFVKSEPRKVRYCADYQSTMDPEYKAIFQDAGWELVYKSAGWYIWRMEYKDERPDIYTDVESLMERNKRLIAVLGFIAAAQVPLMTSIARNSMAFSLLILYTLLYGFIFYGFYKLFAVNSRLKERRKL